MADESEKKEEKNGEGDSGKQIFYSKLEHSKLVGITLDRDERIEYLEKHIAELQEKKINLMIRLRAHEPEKYDPPSYMGYQQDWPVIQKVIFILKRNARALTSLQVMEELLNLEPLYKRAWNDPANSVSSLLSRACKKILL